MDVAGVLKILLVPELLEILRVVAGQSRRVDFDNVVFH